MARLTVSLAAVVAKAAKQRAREQKRSTSSYVELLIEQDLRAAGLLTRAGKATTEAEVAAALAEARRLGIDPVDTLRARIASAAQPTPPAA